ncbi:hypothetical protein DY000_02033223 [Brassica cretica]|uniref:Uncharacterized protein n=1 Tax=Brassica cretica TaxID=69181 RepID=A0ABQ7DY75_BRACR|nr:hypothetical protein DY000_02033223 [Brassica cretica]
MPSSTRSNKEHTLLFSDPTLLERTIRKSKRNASIDNITCSSNDTRLPPSTETILPSTAHTHSTSINIPPRTSIDTEPRDMVATLVLIHDTTGNLHDQDGHLRNAAGLQNQRSGNQSEYINSYGNGQKSGYNQSS